MKSISEMFSLEDELALITGGSTGIGYAIAECFLAAGARVILTARREEVLREAVDKLGDRADYRVHDVTDTAGAPRLVADVEKAHGALTILVNNAGYTIKKPAEELSDGEFQELLDVHVRGAFALTRAVGLRMLERGKGSLLFTASMASLFGIPQVVAYSAAKSAYLGMVRSLATEWSSRGIRVNAISPGWIRTPLLQKTVDADPGRMQRVMERTPMGELGTAEDVGWAAVYLCSPAARFVTGANLVVDGGISIGF